jgi:diguanylate cyclase (GGDEF)-like protein/hemerythrin-like metal-binding protein/PAS domain S-box-containing protein
MRPSDRYSDDESPECLGPPSDSVLADGRYRWVMQKCAAGLAVLNIGGEFLEANPAFCELTGYSPDALSVPGFRLEKLLLSDEVASYHQHLIALSHGEEESYRQPQRIVRQDGAVLWVELTINLMRKADGVPNGLVVTAVDITELRRTEGALRELSFLDPLTKLPNRRLLRDRLKGAVARARREERKVAVLFIDLDGFKPINDTQGHETGDWLLKAVAQRLSGCLREYDTAARLGGDEFVVLLPDLTESEAAAQVAERIRTALASPFPTVDKGPLQISASIGVSLFPDHVESVRDLLLASDEAMYLAKKSGRNQVVHSHRSTAPTPTPVAVDESTSGLVNLTWDASFASGNAFIDAEHRELFHHSNRLLDLTTRPGPQTKAVQLSLLRLVQAIEAHFQHEERILKQASYPGLAGHAARHRALMDRAHELCERANDRSILVADVLNFVVAEVVHGHMVSEDRDYFPFLKGATAP